ncbi:hypothetical protein U9M48_043648 [Paspalum notatum var. saurae]|uniref:Disease resistance protein RPM1 n=1 Tax=Paspalum notatum var. saurae TaxID=547442 RepID=A0AAQ3UV36_PASNO
MADLVLGLAKSAVEGTLTMARSAIEEEEKLQKSVQRDLMLISDEFEMMHSFLSDTKESVTGDMTRTLVRQVRNTALDVEDCIESVVHLDNSSNWWRRLLPSCVPASAPAASLDSAVADLELLKARVEAMGQRNMRYGLSSSSSSRPAETTKLAEARETLQLDILAEARYPLNKKTSPKDLAEMISRKADDGLVPQLQQLQVISVWGTRGDLGTRSIVKKAYDDPAIGKDFVCRAWVRLPHPFNLLEFIRSLLVQFYTSLGSTTADLLNPAEVMVTMEGMLVEEFMKQVNNRRYLIVLELEDVSMLVDWEDVRAFLPDKGNGSCVVVHTQQLEIASLCVGHCQRVLELERLSDDHSICAFINDESNKDDQETAKIESAREWLQGFQHVGRQTNFWGLKSKITRGTVRCIPVCGIAGVGKTSLVKQVYCTMVIEREPFQKFGWVDVMPSPFNLKELCRNLLLDLYSGSLQHASMLRIRDPVQECHGLLQQHRCLIVINDLKSTEEWDAIKADLLAGHNHQSVIVVIAHEESVARYCDSEHWWHVEGLEIEEALDLFQKTVSKKIAPSELSRDVIEEATHVLHMCGGLPRVIIAVADFLAGTGRLNDEECWSNMIDLFMEDLEQHPAFGSLRSLFDWVRSYFRSCPDFLKPCVFYLSIFPLNNLIRRRRLLRRWVAEGYARDDEDSSAEEKAEEFVFKLFLLSMIQVPGQRVLTNYMKMPLCHANGFLREYIVSRSMEDNLVFTLEGHCSVSSSQRTGRHLAVDSSWDRDRVLFRSIDFSRLRSLTVFGRWEPFFVSDKMGLLRVLDLEDAAGLTDDDVGRMVKLLPRLKFLSLRRCEKVTCLPESLGGMRYLQTLDVRYTSVATLPTSITKLHRLQYLRAGANVPDDSVHDDDHLAAAVESQPPPSEESAALPEAIPLLSSSSSSSPSTSEPPDGAGAANNNKTLVSWFGTGCSELWTRCRQRRLAESPNGGVRAPRGIGQLMALHTLGVIDVSVAKGREILEELRNLTRLRKLGVSGVNHGNCRELCSSISGLAQLESLSVRLDKGSRGCLDGFSSPPEYLDLKSLKLHGDAEDELPAWTDQLDGLNKLTLQMAMVTQQGMDVLAGLPELRSLRLRFEEFQNGELLFSEGFDKLEVLEISCNSRLEAVTFHPGVMESLELLKLRCCNRNGSSTTTTRFSGLEVLTALNEVWLSGSYGNQLEEHLKTQLEAHPRKNTGGATLILSNP